MCKCLGSPSKLLILRTTWHPCFKNIPNLDETQIGTITCSCLFFVVVVVVLFLSSRHHQMCTISTSFWPVRNVFGSRVLIWRNSPETLQIILPQPANFYFYNQIAEYHWGWPMVTWIGMLTAYELWHHLDPQGFPSYMPPLNCLNHGLYNWTH